ncbi:MAG: hybrid sensor histidine kinase/response regulator [Candidatus Kapaibacteriota bacterium]|jgi:two-component system sensor histidine kinase/response regulator
MTSFGLSNPIKQSGFSPQAAMRPTKHSQESMETILVVEDNAIVLESIVESLKIHGYHVLQALNGLEAIPLAQKHLPHIILSDIMMDGMDGYALLNELRKDPATALIPFLFMSAKTDFDDIRFAMNLGADDYITKPFSPSSLVTTIKTRISKNAMMQSAVHDKIKQLTENLAYAMPHELRTPMTAIMGCADLIKRNIDPLNTEEILLCSDLIDTSVRRLYRLIEQFNHYAQLTLIEAEPLRRKQLYTQMTMYAGDTINEFVMEEATRNGRTECIVIEDNIGDAVLPIKSYYLEMIVREVLNNAFKFSAPNSPIRVTLSKTLQGYVVSMNDKGRGISKQHIRNIEAFTQFERQQYEQQGVGLGLALVKKILDLYGGKFIMHSEQGIGTTVQMILPLEAPIFDEQAA